MDKDSDDIGVYADIPAQLYNKLYRMRSDNTLTIVMNIFDVIFSALLSSHH